MFITHLISKQHMQSVYVGLSSGLTGCWRQLAVPIITPSVLCVIVHVSPSALQPEASLHVECSVECLCANSRQPTVHNYFLYLPGSQASKPRCWRLNIIGLIKSSRCRHVPSLLKREVHSAQCEWTVQAQIQTNKVAEDVLKKSLCVDNSLSQPSHWHEGQQSGGGNSLLILEPRGNTKWSLKETPAMCLNWWVFPRPETHCLTV